MKKAILLPVAALAAFGLSACSQKAQNETAEAADSIAADVNATTSEAVQDVEAATDKALGAASNTIDDAGNAVDATGDSVDNAVED